MPSSKGSCQQRDQTCVCCPTFEEPGEKQGTAHAPAHNTSSGAGKALKSHLGLTSGHTPTFTPGKEPAHPSQGATEQGNLFSLPPVEAGASVKTCLNFLSGF